MFFKTTFLGDVRQGQTVLLPCEGGFRTATAVEVKTYENGQRGLFVENLPGPAKGPVYTGSTGKVAVLQP